MKIIDQFIGEGFREHKLKLATVEVAKLMLDKIFQSGIDTPRGFDEIYEILDLVVAYGSDHNIIKKITLLSDVVKYYSGKDADISQDMMSAVRFLCYHDIHTSLRALASTANSLEGIGRDEPDGQHIVVNMMRDALR